MKNYLLSQELVERIKEATGVNLNIHEQDPMTSLIESYVVKIIGNLVSVGVDARVIAGMSNETVAIAKTVLADIDSKEVIRMCIDEIYCETANEVNEHYEEKWMLLNQE